MFCKTKVNRKYIQFNDLVFDNASITNADLSGAFKVETFEKSHGHGSYAPLKNNQLLSEEQALSMTIELNHDKVRKKDRSLYIDYVFLNLSYPGRLWAIRGNKVMWAYAIANTFSEPYEESKSTINIDVDFIIPEGVWHVTDPRKTFLLPYTPCDFAYINNLQDSFNCCDPCLTIKDETCEMCFRDCQFLTKENSLCEMRDEAITNLYKQCGNTYRLVYNCVAANQLWEESKLWGHKLCKEDLCYSVIAGRFYSGTILKNNPKQILLYGIWEDPVIEINGKKISIKGNYDGIIMINESGDIYFIDYECCEKTLIDFDLITYENIKIKNGYNSVIVEGGCCGVGCIFIKDDEITL